jgi:hypothetical protein
MKMSFFISGVILLTFSASNCGRKAGDVRLTSALEESNKMVLICTGKSSRKYHLTLGCKGLQNCGRKVLSISKEKATIRYNRTACKLCY